MASSKTGVRLNFYMNPSLVEQIDKFANVIGVSRSAAINLICFNWAQGQDMLSALNFSSNSLLENNKALGGK